MSHYSGIQQGSSELRRSQSERKPKGKKQPAARIGRRQACPSEEEVRMFRGICAWGAVWACGAATASADLTITISAADSYGFEGGEYNLTHTGLGFTPVGLNSSNPFESFCVERDELLSFDTVNYAALNTAAVEGGTGGGSPDPLDPKTAYLYSAFVTGTLPLYVYDVSDGGALRSSAADDLQLVMWYIEEESPISWTPGDLSRRDIWYQLATANAGGSIGNVRVLNMYRDAQGTELVQDLLVMLPEPSSLGLLLLGGLLAARRKG
jgi:hypothetical protein